MSTEKVTKLTGVYSSGYCVIPRDVIESSLSPQAKALYAYICLYAKSTGENKLPFERVILSALCISHACYLKHRRSLSSAGLVTFSQPKVTNANGRKIYGQAMFTLQKQNLDSGYGIIARSVMLDTNISILAKAMYCLLCAYAPSATDSDRSLIIPSFAMHKMLASPSRCRRALNELEASAFIARKNNGRSGCVYTLKLYTDDSCTAKNDASKKAALPDTSCKDINFKFKRKNSVNTGILSDISENTTPIFLVSSEKNASVASSDHVSKNTAQKNTAKNVTKNTITENITKYDNRIDHILNYDLGNMISVVSKQIEAHILRDAYGDDITNAVVITMADVCETDPDIRIGKRFVPAKNVKQVFSMLKFRHIEAVLSRMRGMGDDISNPRAYLMTCLYNAVVDFGVGIASVG